MPALAVCLDDLRLETRAAMDRARRLGFRAIDASAASGPLSPMELTSTGRRHALKHVSDLGLRMASLRGPADGAGFGDSAAAERRLEQLLCIVDLAADLRVTVVSALLGVSRGPDDAAFLSRVSEGLTILADRADRRGVIVAVETAGISVKSLNELLGRIRCPNLAACCDSGAMLMRGEDPHRVGDSLAGGIRLVRVRDAVAGTADSAGHETVMGRGLLDLPRFLAGLEQAGFTGDLVLTRSEGQNPSADLSAAREIVEKAMR
jgi:sugar phosphate isomerase/epimerase